jgi:uncharacterized protein (DUF2384 family)
MQDVEVVRQKAEQVLGDKAKAAVWLSTPRHLFDGMTAIDFVKKRGCLEQVIELLTRIEHGHVC